jgi:hypothetical protein
VAHPQERRLQLRGLYVFKQLPMEAACAAMQLPKTTGNRWKRDAADQGDDWDFARSAVALGDDNFKQTSQILLQDYLLAHKAAIDQLKANEKLDPEARVKILASLGDSFNKTVAAFRRISPEVDRYAIALDVISRFAAFAQGRYPQNVPLLLEMLEAFGAELAKAYG